MLLLTAGGLIFVLASGIQGTHTAPDIASDRVPDDANAPLVLNVTRGDFARYGLELDIELTQLDESQRLQYFRSFVEQEMLFLQAVREGLIWRDPVVQRLVFSNQEFLGVEQMSAELLEELVMNDIGIRRHVVRRAKHILSYINIPEPAEDVLESYYYQHTDQFTTDERVDFEQLVYAQRTDAMAALAVANANEQDPGDAGSSGLPRLLQAAGVRDIGRYFGFPYAQGIFRMAASDTPQDDWYGPIESDFGFHLVKLSNYRAPGAAPYAADIRNKVLGLWRSEQRDIAYQERLQAMKSSLQVVLEDSEPMYFTTVSENDLKVFF